MANKKIAYLTWGRSSQIISYYDFAKYLDALIYLPHLHLYDLSKYCAIVIPDKCDPSYLTDNIKKQINDFVTGGGFLIAFSLDGNEQWIDAIQVDFIAHPNKDWLWWTKPNPYIELKQVNKETSLNKAIPLKDMAWHWKGVYQSNQANAISYLNTDDDVGSLLLDFPNLANGGRVLVSTLDPHSHNGERFMPATTTFLQKFYPWLNSEIKRQLIVPKFTITYIQSGPFASEREPQYLAQTFVDTPGTLKYLTIENITAEALSKTDIVYLPSIHDEYILMDKTDIVMEYLNNGGHFIISSEVAMPWLSILKPFQAVKPRPFDNLKTRIRNDPFGFFDNMPDGFDGWEGIFGQYVRGWSQMPENAIWLTDIGDCKNPKPGDWLWQPQWHHHQPNAPMPGKLFMHNGDNLIRYPDFGEHKECLLRDICIGMIKYRHVPINPFSRFEHII